MSLITWSDNLSVGNMEIDNQHKKLVAMVNQLHDAMAAGRGKEALQQLFSEMVRYTAVHFRSEEQYMQKCNYPDLVAHKREHEELTRKAVDLKKRFEGGHTILTVQTLEFLRDWLKGHILGTDKKYAPYLTSARQAVGCAR